jgi:deoxyribose-phosphate aldolase
MPHQAHPKASDADRPPPARNPGTPLALDWVRRVRAPPDGVAPPRRARAPDRPRPPARDRDRLRRVVACLDLTCLEDDATADRVRALCATARQPLGEPGLRVAAVCVHHRWLDVACQELAGSGVTVAVVSAGFPLGDGPVAQRVAEIRAAVADGADEIDAVIPRGPALAGDWKTLYDETCAYRAACDGAVLKAILATGVLPTLDHVAQVGAVCLMAGADFLKTSTGREPVNATLPAGMALARVLRAYQRRTGHRAGLKPAGGITTAGQALDWARLVEQQLGRRALHPTWFRIGASRLLTDIRRALARGGPDA